jgi:hypothetical protein
VAVPILIRRLPGPARRKGRPAPPLPGSDRVLDLLAAAAAAWTAVALVLAVLVALAVAVAVVLVAGLTIADAAPSATAPAPGFPGSRPAAGSRLPSAAGYHEPQATPGAGRSGGVRKAGSASRSSAPSGAAAAASRLVSGGRFHLHSSSFSTDV